jgi:Putative transposase/Transposase zinc-binding domain
VAPAGTAPPIARPRLELADIVRAHGEAYARQHRLAPVQHRALRAITACRTAALGGHQATCDRCGAVRVSYNSCRNRHCPKCQTLTKERWLAARTADLLPIPYFHAVFTLPHDLNALAQGNPRVIYTRLFRAAADTLLAFGRDPRYLGGTIGITAILHTWGQTLAQHLHLHCLVTGGALAGNGTRWIRGRPSFLFPVRAMATVFRAKYLAGLLRAYEAGDLTFAGGTAALADRRAFAGFLGHLRAVRWVVYAKRPFAGPAQVLGYLGRYTHRVALSNDRLVDHAEGRVRFRWKDYADHDRVKVMTLEADEFLRRFLLHVVPRGFMRIRHFGLLANRTRRDTLRQCRGLLGQPPPAEAAPESSAVLLLRLTGVDLARCPVCREGRMQITMLVVQVRPPPETS